LCVSSARVMGPERCGSGVVAPTTVRLLESHCRTGPRRPALVRLSSFLSGSRVEPGSRTRMGSAARIRKPMTVGWMARCRSLSGLCSRKKVYLVGRGTRRTMAAPANLSVEPAMTSQAPMNPCEGQGSSAHCPIGSYYPQRFCTWRALSAPSGRTLQIGRSSGGTHATPF
jgi:hypothetical protein